MGLPWQRCERVSPRPGLFPFCRYFPSAYALGYAVSSLRDLNRECFVVKIERIGHPQKLNESNRERSSTGKTGGINRKNRRNLRHPPNAAGHIMRY
jgi:hypothetical protein